MALILENPISSLRKLITGRTRLDSDIQRPPVDGLRTVRFSNALRVSGEAVRVVITVTEPTDFTFAELPDEMMQRIRKLIEKEAAKIERSRHYHVDRITPNAESVYVYVFAREKAAKPSLLREPVDNPGEQWIGHADAFQERVRERVTALLRSDVGGDSRISVASIWEPGSGVLASGGILDEKDDSRRLEEDLWAYQIRLSHNKRRMSICLALICYVFLGGVVALVIARLAVGRNWLGLLDDPFVMLLAIYWLIGLVFLISLSLKIRDSVRRARDEVREIVTKIDLRAVSDEKQKHAYKLFQLNNEELKRYYDQALHQRSLVFILGVVCIFAGFAVIIWAISAIRGLPPEEALEEKIVIAILGGAGSLLADFVAVIFLRMFSEIVASTVEFHMRLVGTNRAHFGNVLAARINSNELSDQTLNSLAVAMVSLGSERGEAKHIDAKLPAQSGKISGGTPPPESR